MGTAFSIYVFHELVNPQRSHIMFEPTSAQYFIDQTKRLNVDKVGLKWARENSFGITVNPEQYPYDSLGVYYYPERYHFLKSSVEHVQLINKQAAEYLKGAIERASRPQAESHQAAHH